MNFIANKSIELKIRFRSHSRYLQETNASQLTVKHQLMLKIVEILCYFSRCVKDSVEQRRKSVSEN